MSSSGPRKIVVIGGGITGLAAAFRLSELHTACRVLLLEADSRTGGVLRSETHGAYLAEYGPDMFSTADPWAMQLCQRLGLDQELVNTDERFRRALIVKRGRLLAIPEGFVLLQPRKLLPLLLSPLLSLRGRLRLLAEPFIVARRDTRDESLAAFAIRRFGREAFERMIQPLVGSIYTADAHQLSMRATMSRFVALEQQHGSLIRAALAARKSSSSNQTQENNRSASGARYGMFVAPRLGMQQLVDTLSARLHDCLRLNHRVTSLEQRPGGGWRVAWQSPDGRAEASECDAVIVATPARVAARLLRWRPELAEMLEGIPQASSAVALLGYEKKQISHPLDAFGFVVPICERRNVLAASFASVKFPGRAPENRVLIRVFVGGACQPHLLEQPDETILAMAHQELKELLGIDGSPDLSRLIRWNEAMPQYHVGHLDRVERIEQAVARLPNLALAGNAYQGVGIPFCVHSGERAAESIVAGG
jgi:protoporphyrinogen/coproporphyrinogen III oxidase